MTLSTQTATRQDLLDLKDELLEVIQDLVQMTSQGFERLEARMDRMDSRMDTMDNRVERIEVRLESIDDRLAQIESRLREHDLQFAELKAITQELVNKNDAYMNDISDILDRVVALEERPSISAAEKQELQRLLRLVVDWAIKASKVVKVPVKLHS